MRLQPLAILTLLGATTSAALAQPVTNYGPIIGRGATSDKMIIHWGTNNQAANNNTTVSYRQKGAATAQTATAARICKADSGANCDYEVTLSGLSTATEYEYSIAGQAIDGSLHFTTCPAAGQPLDIVFYGDSRSGGSVHATVASNVLAAGADIVFESGDIQYSGNYDGYFSASDTSLGGTGGPGFFKSAKNLVSQISFMAVPGNHDAGSSMPANYGLMFPNPNHPLGDASWVGYYSFTCGSSMFIGLDGNSGTDTTQTNWLKTQLAAGKSDANVAHIFVWFHQSPYSIGAIHGDDKTTQGWTPLFEDPASKVRAVFTGHDHNYQRLQHGGLTYIVSGGAGAGLYALVNSDSAGATVLAKKQQYNFVKLHVTNSFITGAAFDGMSGQPLVNDLTNAPDTFTLYGSASDMGGGGGGTGGGGSGGTSGGGGNGGTSGGGGSGGTSGGAGNGGGNGGTSGGGGNGDTGGGHMGGGGCNMAQAANGGTVGLLLFVVIALLVRGRRSSFRA